MHALVRVKQKQAVLQTKGVEGVNCKGFLVIESLRMKSSKLFHFNELIK